MVRALELAYEVIDLYIERLWNEAFYAEQACGCPNCKRIMRLVDDFCYNMPECIVERRTVFNASTQESILVDVYIDPETTEIVIIRRIE